MRDDDIEQIMRSGRTTPNVDSNTMHILAMLSLICKALRDGGDNGSQSSVSVREGDRRPD